MMTRLALVGAAFVGIAGLREGQPPRSTLEGVWKLTRVAVIAPAQPPNNAPQPSLYMFSRSHYSLIRVNGSSPRPLLPKDRLHATPSQLLAVLGEGFSAQGGDYVVADGVLTLRPQVSKEPQVMGGWAKFDVKLSSSSAVLVTREDFNGPPVVVTEFTLSRVE